MKKFFMTVIAALMVGVACFANEPKAECQVTREVNELTAVNQMTKSCFADPMAHLIFFIGDEKIEFSVYEKLEINDKIYFYGRGSNGMHAICIDGTKLYIPLTGNRQLVVDSENVVERVMTIVNC